MPDKENLILDITQISDEEFFAELERRAEANFQKSQEIDRSKKYGQISP